MNDITLDVTIRRLCREYRPKSYLEVGTNEGRSLQWVLQSAGQLERIAICDDWGTKYGGFGFPNHDHISEIMDRNGFSGERVWLDGRSLDVLPKILNGPGYDLILIDADHSFGGCMVDTMMGWALLNAGGWIVMDDINHHLHGDLEVVAKRIGQMFSSQIEQSVVVNSPPHPPCGHAAFRKLP